MSDVKALVEKALDEAMGNLHTEVMKEIAAEHRALDEWRENGGPDWRDDHPAIMRLKRLQTFAAASRAARSGQ